MGKALVPKESDAWKKIKDKVTEAFRELNNAGIMAVENYSLSSGDAVSGLYEEIELSDDPEQYKGYAFYDIYIGNEFKDSGILSLDYGAYNEDGAQTTESVKAVAETIKQTFERAGLNVQNHESTRTFTIT